MSDMRDPLKWVYLYRPEDEESAMAAQVYRDARGLPYHHLIPCSGLSSTEELDETDYDTLKLLVQSYINDNSMSGVSGLIIGYGMPRYVMLNGRRFSLCSMLSQLGNNTPDVVNPMYRAGAAIVDDLPDRQTLPPAGMYLVADMHLDVEDPVGTLVNRSEALGCFAVDDTPVSFLNPSMDILGYHAGDDDAIGVWADSNLARRLALTPLNTVVAGQSTQVFGPGESVSLSDTAFDDVDQHLGLWVDERDESLLESDLSTSETEGSALTAARAGYAYAVGYVDAPSNNAWLDVTTFFTALYAGATLVEAVWLASPKAHHGLRIIGDPLRGPMYPLNRVEFWDDKYDKLLWVSPDVAEPSVQLQGVMDAGPGLLRVTRYDNHGVKSPEAHLEVFTDGTGLTRLKVRPVSVMRVRQVSGTEIRLSWALTEKPGYRVPESYELLDMNTGVSLAIVTGDASQVFYTHAMSVEQLGGHVWIGVRSVRGEDVSPLVSGRLSLK